MHPLSPRTAVRAAAAVLGLLTLCAVRGVAAEGGVYIYSLNTFGKLSVDGTVLDDLPGEFDVDDDDVDHLEQAWTGLVVEGPDRYMLRYDGLVVKNGKKIFRLPYHGYRWVGMAVENGTVFCLTADGVIAVDNDIVGDLAMEGYGFLALAVYQGRVYSLRSDGQTFRDADRDDFIRFEAGPGRASFFPDGWAVDTLWNRIAVDPVGGRLIALRTDGNLYGAPLSGINRFGTEIAELPFIFDTDADGDDRTDEFPVLDDSYTDLETNEEGAWWVLSADGRVYSEYKGALVPEGDLPDQPDERTTLYYDLAVRGTDFWVVRNDARVYFDGQTPPILELPGTSYGRIAVSPDRPDTSSVEEHPPRATILHTRTVAKQPLTIPVAVSDTETATADLVVTPYAIPADSTGSTAVWDPAARALHWDAPQVPGTYKFRFDVSDGASTVRFVYVIEVLYSVVDDPAENKPPKAPTISKARAIVGQPYSLPIIVDDRDEEDTLTVTPDLTKYPYTAGATFDAATNTFAWTPAAEDVGDVKLKFPVSDGIKKKTVEFTLKVRDASAAPTDEHPPNATLLHTRTIVGTPLAIPAVVDDLETPAADLVVTPFAIPSDKTGSTAVWDEAARVLRWDAPQAAGTYKFKFDVSDGAKTVRFVYVIEVLGDPDENKGPNIPTITDARAIVGQPFSVPIIVGDRDLDPIEVGVDLEDYPYTAGATFDKTTNTFSWTPTSADQGDVKLRFKVSDGTVEKTVEFVLKVKNGLIF